MEDLIRLLVTDVDGTLTDGKIYMSSGGELCKAFHIKDGLGIKDILPKFGIACAVITGRDSAIVANRCRELNIRYLFQGVADKVECLKNLINELGLQWQEVAYIGDDLNDLAVMSLCGIKVCPADAAREVKGICDFVSTYNGGDGAVREFIEFLTR